MLGAVILRPERQGIAQLCTGIGNSAAADISVMGRFSVVASEECIRSGRISASAIFIGPGKVVDIRHADTVFHIPYTAEMNQNRIPFRGNRNIVSTAASDISDSGKSLPIINDCQLTGNIPFFHYFIKHLRMADTVGRLRRLICGHHNGNRPGSGLCGRNPFIRIYASHITCRPFLRIYFGRRRRCSHTEHRCQKC